MINRRGFLGMLLVAPAALKAMQSVPAGKPFGVFDIPYGGMATWQKVRWETGGQFDYAQWRAELERFARGEW